jgi:DNA polymerase
MGAGKFQATLESGAMGPAMKFTIDEAYEVVNTYRSTYSGIPLLWKKLELKLANTINPSYEESWHGLRFHRGKIHLPNGMALHYNNLRYEGGKLTYDSRTTESTWGGRIAENVVQALSRIIVTDSMLRIQQDKNLDAEVVLTVHDEIVLISNANDPDATMNKLIAHMCNPPSWAQEIPLDAEGGYDFSYSK